MLYKCSTNKAELISKTIVANGIYDASSSNADGFHSVTVNVPKQINVDEIEITENGVYNSSTNELDGYNKVTVAVEPNVDSKDISQNGTYNASDDGLDGYSSITVDVEGGGADLGTKNITENGTYDAGDDNLDGYSSVTVNVSGGGNLGTKNITENGTYDAGDDNLDGYDKVTVNVGGSIITLANYLNLTLAQKITSPYKIGNAKFALAVDNTIPQVASYDFENASGAGITPTDLNNNRYKIDFDSNLSKSFEVTIEGRFLLLNSWGGNAGVFFVGNSICGIYFYNDTLYYIFKNGNIRAVGLTRGDYFEKNSSFELAISAVYDDYDEVVYIKVYINNILVDTYAFDNTIDFSYKEFAQYFASIVKKTFYLGEPSSETYKHTKPLKLAVTTMELTANDLLLKRSPIQFAVAMYTTMELSSNPAIWNNNPNKNSYGFVASAKCDVSNGHIALNGVDAQSGNVVTDRDIAYDHLMYPANSNIETIGATGRFWEEIGVMICASSILPFVDADFYKLTVNSSGSITLPKAYQRVVVAVALSSLSDFANNAISLNGAVIPNETTDPTVSGYYTFHWFREYDNVASGTTFALTSQSLFFSGAFMVIGCNV